MYEHSNKITLGDGTEITAAEAIGRPARDFAEKGRRKAMWQVTTGVEEDGSAIVLSFTHGGGELNNQICTGAVVIDATVVATTITGLLRSYDKYVSPREMDAIGAES